MTSPDAFFIFFKILVFWVVRGVGGKSAKNGTKWKKKFCLTLCLRNCTSYDCGFWYSCKIIISSNLVFPFFQNSHFSGFSKFINKCQKEILRCAPLSSNVCDFIYTWMILILFNSIKSWIRFVWACYIAGQSFVYIYVFHKFTEMFVKKFLLVPHYYSYK